MSIGRVTVLELKEKKDKSSKALSPLATVFLSSSFAYRDMDARLLKMTTSLLKNLKIREHILM